MNGGKKIKLLKVQELAAGEGLAVSCLYYIFFFWGGVSKLPNLQQRKYLVAL